MTEVVLNKNLRKSVIAKIRHELRNPLNSIIGYSELILEELQDTESEQVISALETIHNNGQNLLAIITNIFNNIETWVNQDFKLNWQDITHQIHDEIYPDLNNIIGTATILLKNVNPNFLPDIEKIQDAANNMIYLAKDLVKLAEASSLQSETFYNCLLALTKKEESKLVESLLDTINSGKLNHTISFLPSNCSILVVEDNPNNRDILARHLKNQGYQTELVENGRKALEIIKNKSFDLVLLDIIMPDLNGYEVLNIMKEDEHLKEIPVIVLSALDNLESIVSCIKIGAEDYLSKPYDPVLLKARINACLEKKLLRDRELEYLDQVKKITAAAAALETKTFEADSLSEVAQRTDALGSLARVFSSMAKEVYKREEQLKQQVQQLLVEIDEVKKEKEVKEIIDSDYFQNIQKKASQLRSIHKKTR